MSEDAQQVAEGGYTEMPVEEPLPEEAPQPAPGFAKRFFARKINLVIIVAVVAIVVVASVGVAMMGGGGSMFAPTKQAPAPLKLTQRTVNMPPYDGEQVRTGQTFEWPISFADNSTGGGGGNSSKNASAVTNIIKVTVNCKWTDDYSGSQPDEMKFELVSTDGTNVSQLTQGTSGAATLTIKTNTTADKIDDNTNGWVLRVTCVKAGGKPVGPLGFLIYVDAGNDFSAQVSYDYYGPESGK